MINDIIEDLIDTWGLTREEGTDIMIAMAGYAVAALSDREIALEAELICEEHRTDNE